MRKGSGNLLDNPSRCEKLRPDGRQLGTKHTLLPKLLCCFIPAPSTGNRLQLCYKSRKCQPLAKAPSASSNSQELKSSCIGPGFW